MATKKNKNNTYKSLFIFTLIILLSFVITVYIKCPDAYKFSFDQKKELSSSKLLKNTWVSSMDGSMLNFKKNNIFEIDVPSVESSKKITGKYIINKNDISFTFDPGSDVCKKIPGKYSYKITDNKLEFVVISDKCNSRKYQLTGGWFRF